MRSGGYAEVGHAVGHADDGYGCHGRHPAVEPDRTGQAEASDAIRGSGQGRGIGLPTARQLTAAGRDAVGADLAPGRPRDPGRFDALPAFSSLLMPARDEIPYTSRMVREPPVSARLFALPMVDADLDDFAIPFLGNMIRVSGYLPDDVRRAVRDEGFEIVDETSYAYAPASTDAPPEEQLFLYRQRPV